MARGATTNPWRTFLAVWAGQAGTELGSDLTSFALAVWVYQQTESATLYSFLALVGILPQVVVWPVAGALVDRWHHRKALMLGELCAAVCMCTALILAATGMLRVWHAFAIAGAVAIAKSLSYPALSATTALLVPASQLGRANGLIEMGQAGSQLMSPALAGFLLATTGIAAVFVLDVATFAVSISILLVVRLPRPRASAQVTTPSIREDLRLAWRYIASRPALSALVVVLAVSMFTMGMVSVLLTPLILGITTVAALGVIHLVGGLGMLAGGLLMVAWGGPRRRVRGMLACVALQGLVLLVLGAVQPTELRIAAGAFAFLFAMAVLNGCNQSLWQTQVPPELHGRVLSLRTTLTWGALPLAYLAAGPLAEGVFEPWMAPGGWLAGSVGQLIGAGPGRGIALLFMLLGAILVIVAGVGFSRRELRECERRDDARVETPRAGPG